MTAKLPNGLTVKQDRFVDEYMIDGNGQNSAIRAGYSKSGAAAQASALLRIAKVAEEIERRRARQVERTAKGTAITKEWLVEQVISLANKAIAAEDYAPARGCYDLVARLHGMIIDRKDVRMSLLDLPDEELAAEIAKLEKAASEDRRGTKH